LLESAQYSFGPYVLDRPRRLLLRDGAVVALTPKVFDLLSLLVEHEGQVVSKETLMTRLWPDTVVEESNLTFQMSALRKALGEGRYVVTIPGRGYQFAGAVETIVEKEERTTITVSDERRTVPWFAIAIGAVVLIAAVVAFVLSRRPPRATMHVASLAVLPFRPIAVAQRNESLELGMADTLITRLSPIPAIIVRPTSAIRRYSALDQDPLAAGRELGVDSVLDGSIHRSGDRMRVTVRLLRVADGTTIWADHFDESVRDLFAVQDRVADGVARALAPSLSGHEQELLRKRTTDNLEAYDLYMKGQFVRDREPSRALEFYEGAIARDPQFAAAWAAIAETWIFRGRYTNNPPREQFEKARAAAEKAIVLDPALSDAHRALASVDADYYWRWDDADREYRRALELNPNDPDAHSGYAYLLVFRRRFDEALAHSRRAVELHPLSGLVLVGHGVVLRFSGRNEEAIRHLTETLRLLPNLPPALLHLGMAQTNAGRPAEGMKTLHDALAYAHNNSQIQALYAYAAAKAGHLDEALLMMRKLEALGAHEHVATPNMAIAWTALGDHDKAFANLERAYADHLFLLRTVTVEPGFEPLRSDPRYKDLVRRMGL
jgi:DNA-binding winged helix-turn-helix (wHTH) protein/TolB-like protein/Flp pilus assembly protein TadD